LKLAKVEFTNPAPVKDAVLVAGNTSVLSPVAAAAPAAVHLGEAQPASTCPPLAPGHHRRIFFGMENPSDDKSPFGLGYEEIDYHEGVAPEDQTVVAGTSVPVTAYDPNRPPVCLPLGPAGTPVHETWELVNLATETHSFHIRQTKFRVVDAAGPQTTPETPVILQDNIPVPFAVASIPDIDDSQNGYCTIEQWKTHKCAAQPIVLDIPFSKLGEFVFHCHILEHEDGGMMAKIQVVRGGM
jgi:hypothetical protein